jgi:NAD+ kinase
MKLGLMGYAPKLNPLGLFPPLVRELRARNISFVIEESLEAGDLVERHEQLPGSSIPDAADVILSFGGDGTLLRTAQTVGKRRKPILGVNPGPGLGYLTELSVDELPGALDAIMQHRFTVEERMMLQAGRHESTQPVCFALNDVIVGHSPFFRTMRIEVMIDGSPVTTYRCDGLVVATPTGSTAYALSAGGPIVEPTLEMMLVTPVCPHTLTMRPVVVSAKRTIEIRSDEEAILAADGDNIMPLSAGDTIRVSRAPFTSLIANVSGRDFYEVLRGKMHWGATHYEPNK